MDFDIIDLYNTTNPSTPQMSLDRPATKEDVHVHEKVESLPKLSKSATSLGSLKPKRQSYMPISDPNLKIDTLAKDQSIPRKRSDLPVVSLSLSDMLVSAEEPKQSNHSGITRFIHRNSIGVAAVTRSKDSFQYQHLAMASFDRKSQQIKLKRQSKITKEISDSVLRSLTIGDFNVVWNNCIGRLYFLMFLIRKDQECFYFLRMETLEFRSTFETLLPATRIAHAKRIFNSYLRANADYPMIWPLNFEDASPVSLIIDVISHTLENPDANIFDDLSYLAQQGMEQSYRGVFNHPDGQEVPDNCSFKNSVFYHSMATDLSSSVSINALHIKRLVERIIDLVLVLETESLCERLRVYLELFCQESGLTLPAPTFKMSSPRHIRRGVGPTVMKLHSSVSIKEFSHVDESSTQSTTLGKASTLLTVPERAKAYQHTHTFLPSKSEASQCQYCFNEFSFKGSDDPASPYRCETCGYTCHRFCRTQMHITCAKLTGQANEDTGLEHGSERIRLLSEKVAALQKEVDIELKIQQGLERIIKVKQISIASKKHCAADTDILAQYEKSSTKLDGLKHEMQKRRLQIKVLQAKQDEQIKDEAITSNVSLDSNLDIIDTIESYESKNDENDGGLLRVIAMDPDSKLETKKAIYILNSQSTESVIQTILLKANIPGSIQDFNLSYLDMEQNIVILKNEERPLQVENVNYAETIFRLIVLFALTQKAEERIGVPVVAKEDPLKKKQQEIMAEIYETEAKYASDLNLVVNVFLNPFIAEKLEIDHSAIFSNIALIATLHSTISENLQEDHQTHGEFQASALISEIGGAIGSFGCYIEYCGNQHTGLRVLKGLQDDQIFVKILQKCEMNPKLHKLNLSDMLAKPMQRITRYPLLLKRLLPTLEAQSNDHRGLTELIFSLEKILHVVNDTVRVKEAAFRIHTIDEGMDFGSLDKFKIAAEDRELSSEKTFTLFKKGGSTGIEVTVLLFNDLLLIVKHKKLSFQLLKPPIPLEDVMFSDKIESGPNSKNLLQILHFGHGEIYTLQSYTTFDKTGWLHEAEIARATFTAFHSEMEAMYIRKNLVRYKTIQANLSNISRRENSPGMPEVEQAFPKLTRNKAMASSDGLTRRDTGKRGSMMVMFTKIPKKISEITTLLSTSSIDVADCVSPSTQYVAPFPVIVNGSVMSIDSHLSEEKKKSSKSSMSRFASSVGNIFGSRTRTDSVKAVPTLRPPFTINRSASEDDKAGISGTKSSVEENDAEVDIDALLAQAEGTAKSKKKLEKGN